MMEKKTNLDAPQVSLDELIERVAILQHPSARVPLLEAPADSLPVPGDPLLQPVAAATEVEVLVPHSFFHLAAGAVCGGEREGREAEHGEEEE